MRQLTKGDPPEALAANASTWLAEFLADPTSSVRRYRYRDPAIKEALRVETGSKCVYCESKIGHNTPGDVEHKVPTSKKPEMHFEWLNLTIACTECNRRKSDYYDEADGFLDPYVDEVETCLVHLGPLVHWSPGHVRAETAVRTLELHSMKRTGLVDRKRDVLEKIRALLDLAQRPDDPLLQALRKDEVARMARIDAEYSAMVLTYLKQVGHL